MTRQKVKIMTNPLRLLILGAHPDDADYSAGGLAALYASAGHVVRMVSLTNGDAGHHEHAGAALATRRRAEADAAAAVIGATYQVLVTARDRIKRPGINGLDHVWTLRVVDLAAPVKTLGAAELHRRQFAALGQEAADGRGI